MEVVDWILGVLVRGMALGTPLLWGALGEIYADRAGVVNLGVEGMMILGAFFAFAAAQLSGHPGLGLLVAAVIGGMAALLHAFVSVTLRAIQFLSGLVLSMLGLGLAGLLGRGWEGFPLSNPLPELSILPPLGVLLAAALWGLLYHTRWGIILRTVGESPAAADAMGIDVALVRYLAVIFGGMLAGVAGGGLCGAGPARRVGGGVGGGGGVVGAPPGLSPWGSRAAALCAACFGTLFHL